MNSDTQNDSNFEPQIIAFCCNYCAYAAADMAGSARLSYAPNVKIIRFPCSGKVDVLHLLHAFESGADGAYVAACLEGTCHFMQGNLRAKKRVAYAKQLLEEVGIESERLQMFFMSAAMGGEFARVANEMTKKIKELGPNPVKKNQL